MNPFLAETDCPLVALRGKRAGYIQVAPSTEQTSYAGLSEEALLAARDWAMRMEALGAKRVYWITLSEVVRHLHIHLYPRWEDDEPHGLPLFEQREQMPQPPWTEAHQVALDDWCRHYRVYLIE